MKSKMCPTCGARFEDDQRVCPNDGEVLADDSEALVNTTFDGLYHIERLLGRGGMGTVYLARHVLLRDRVAIKILSKEMSGNAEWLRRFLREGRAARAIRHPNAVTVHELRISSDGVTYMVLEYVDGHTLRVEMERRGRFGLEEALSVLEPVASLLDEAHAQGVVHRDLKPENIMIGAGEAGPSVKVLDLGIAKLRELSTATIDAPVALTLPGQIVGTPHYMSPEQWGEPSRDGSPEIDGRADVYSLGVLTYEMVAGIKPFLGRTLQEVRWAHVSYTPPPLEETVPGVPRPFGAAVARAVAKDREDRQRAAGVFVAELRATLDHRAISGEEGRDPEMQPRAVMGDEGALVRTVPLWKGASHSGDAARTIEPTLAASRARVVILYKRGARPDEDVLGLLETELGARGYEVFVDRHLTVGVEWAREIERQVRGADAVIPMLSAASASSEMLAHEVQIAHEAAHLTGRPRLLPVRIDFSGPLPTPIAGILNQIQHAAWTDPGDDHSLVAKLLDGLRAPTVQADDARRAALEPVGGAVPLDSRFYIVRPADEEFRAAMARRDSIVLVKGARQMGKTSLLARGLQQAREGGARVVLTDFQDVSASDLVSAETLFLTLGESIAEQLDLDVLPREVWNPDHSANRNFGRYMRREVLERVDGQVVWGLDEVDRLFSCDFGSEVFGLFRSWHNRRSLDPTGPWQRLTLAIAYATEAHLFITDVNQSPFNVGTRLALEDFTLDQVAELDRRYASPLPGAAEMSRFYELVGGHPYLVRRGLHEMAQGVGFPEFEAEADRDEGPLGDHLRRMLVLLAKDPTLCDVVRDVLRGGPCPTAESFYRLRSAGVMAGESAQTVRPRCRLYATYLSRHLL